ncbi:hypothetical protein FRC01_007684 [Tulasnella sp. 417]|nr:hypothetical protein FRC01_007684 [Tulasnella sp. 417]
MFAHNNQATTGPFLTTAPSGAGAGGGTAVGGSPDIEADLHDELGGLPRGNITAPASSRWESMFRRFNSKNRLNKIWECANEFMTVPMWAKLLSLIVGCQPFQHVLQDHIQPVKGPLVAAGKCSIPVTLVVSGAYFYTPPLGNSTTEDVPPRPAPTAAAAGAEEDDRDARRRSGSHWTSSELSIAMLTDNIREAIKLRVGGYKNLGSPTASKMELREQLARKGEAGRSVAALACWDLQRATDDPVFVVSMVLLVSSPPALTLAQITQAAPGDAFERLISKTIFWSCCIFTPPSTIVYVLIGLPVSKM